MTHFVARLSSISEMCFMFMLAMSKVKQACLVQLDKYHHRVKLTTYVSKASKL